MNIKNGDMELTKEEIASIGRASKQIHVGLQTYESMLPPLLRTSDCAALWQVSTPHFRDVIASDPNFPKKDDRLGPNTIRYPRDEVLRYLHSGRSEDITQIHNVTRAATS